MPRIQRASTDDWRRVREVRLRALEDAPSAFAARLEQERDRPEAFWRERLAEAGSATFLALDGDAVVGLVGVFLDEGDPGSAHLVSMWVAPEHRRRGVGRALVDAVIAWARRAPAQRIVLWVTETNETAWRLYREMGFEETGDRQPLPSDPSLGERKMARPV